MDEQWLPVVGYEGLYEVSDLGRVRSLDRIVITRSGPRRYRSKILKPDISTHGYPYVLLSKVGVHTRHFVHLLVLREFQGPRPAGQEARHGPTGKLDASLVNLCWGTRSENVGADRLRDGQDNRGERHGLAVLTREIVLDIRQRVEAGARPADLARYYGVSAATVRAVVHRKSWDWL